MLGREDPRPEQRRNRFVDSRTINAPSAANVVSAVTPNHPPTANACAPSAAPEAMPMKTPVMSTAFNRLCAAGSRP